MLGRGGDGGDCEEDDQAERQEGPPVRRRLLSDASVKNLAVYRTTPMIEAGKPRAVRVMLRNTGEDRARVASGQGTG
jgi:hypothetical protein